jgi:hypothetical protein
VAGKNVELEREEERSANVFEAAGLVEAAVVSTASMLLVLSILR